MKYFIDTEFIESGPRKPIQLISIGIVAEDGREFEAVSNEFNPDDASEWVQENVLLKLDPQDKSVWLSLFVIKHLILEFVGADPKPEFWGYYADYDWVVFCQIFGTMMDLPKGWPMYCRDIKQLCDEKGNPELPEQGKGEHNALADARWNKLAHAFLAFPYCECGTRITWNSGIRFRFCAGCGKKLTGEHDALSDARWNPRNVRGGQ